MDKIVCVGKNYVEHAKELGDAVPEKPVLFLKPPSVLKQAQGGGEALTLRIPPDAGELHHECEIVLRLGDLPRDGYRLSVDEARAAIADVTLGLDMTLRERQAKLKKAGHPWEISKAFLDSAVVGPWKSVREFPHYLEERFTLAIDGAIRQAGLGREMTLAAAECVAYASEHFPLRKGDLIFTGTPAGVGPVKAGQRGELSWGSIRYGVRWEEWRA